MGIQNHDKNIIEIFKKAEEKTKVRPQQLPSIDFEKAKGLKPKTNIKPISTGGPIKAQMQPKPNEIQMEI